MMVRRERRIRKLIQWGMPKQEFLLFVVVSFRIVAPVFKVEIRKRGGASTYERNEIAQNCKVKEGFITIKSDSCPQ